MSGHELVDDFMNISEEQRGIPDGERKRILAVTTLACILFASSMTMGDPDLWGHTLYGIRAHEQGVLVERTDPFSYTAQGAEWVNHEWLTEMAYGLLWTNFGNSGLVAW